MQSPFNSRPSSLSRTSAGCFGSLLEASSVYGSTSVGICGYDAWRNSEIRRSSRWQTYVDVKAEARSATNHGQ